MFQGLHSSEWQNVKPLAHRVHKGLRSGEAAQLVVAEHAMNEDHAIK